MAMESSHLMREHPPIFSKKKTPAHMQIEIMTKEKPYQTIRKVRAYPKSSPYLQTSKQKVICRITEKIKIRSECPKYQSMKQFIYKIIYNSRVNYVLRNIIRPFRNFLPKRIWLSPSGSITIKINDKPLTLETNQTSFLSHLLFWQGPQKFEYTPIFLSLIPNISCFLDIGANIGYYSILAASVNPNLSVFSFEPASGPLHYLKKNISRNNLTNISVQPIALSDKIGNIDFYEVCNQKYENLDYNLAGDGNTGSIEDSRAFQIISVPTTTLDDFVLGIEPIKLDLIKLDTEGTENLILNNAHRILKQYQPIVICETLFGKIEGELEDIFKIHGYSFYNHVGKGLVKVDSIRRVADNGVTNCFFIPKSKESLLSEYLMV
jgi:FkbM family methyltransferase